MGARLISLSKFSRDFWGDTSMSSAVSVNNISGLGSSCSIATNLLFAAVTAACERSAGGGAAAADAEAGAPATAAAAGDSGNNKASNTPSSPSRGPETDSTMVSPRRTELSCVSAANDPAEEAAAIPAWDASSITCTTKP